MSNLEHNNPRPDAFHSDADTSSDFHTGSNATQDIIINEDDESLPRHAYDDDPVFGVSKQMEVEPSCSPQHRDSHLPQGTHFDIIRSIATEHGFEAVDVPGDGSCFFHALSLGLNKAGHAMPPGSVMRAETGRFLTLDQQRKRFIDFMEVTDTVRFLATVIILPAIIV